MNRAVGWEGGQFAPVVAVGSPGHGADSRERGPRVGLQFGILRSGVYNVVDDSQEWRTLWVVRKIALCGVAPPGGPGTENAS